MKKTIILAYSGGLDTSFCIPWLKEEHHAEVHAVLVDCIGLSPGEIEASRNRAIFLGASRFEAIDGFPDLYKQIISYLIKGNVLRDRTYPLCVGAERFIQAALVAEYAKKAGTTSIAHGSTGAGNDQVRFDVALRTILKDVEIITPIRDHGLSREFTTDYLIKRGFDVPQKTTTYSINDGIWGTSIGGKETSTSNGVLPFEAFPNIKAPHEYDDAPEDITVEFKKGLPVALDGETMNSGDLLNKLLEFGRHHGLGAGMHLGDTILGIKGRIGFEAPVATILYAAHRELEKLVLTQQQRHIKDTLADTYGMMLHEAKFYDPAMRDIEAFFDSTQQMVTGTVTLYACRGNLFPKGTTSPFSLMEASTARYGEEAAGWTGEEARAFSKLNGFSSQFSYNRSKA
ncbi:MAG: argininosuccinate synthase [Balneolales bacterium]